MIKIGSTTHIIDQFGRKQQSNTDTQIAIQAQLDAMPSAPMVYEFEWDAEKFDINNPMRFPVTAGATVRKVIMKGTGYSGYRSTTGGLTCLVASASFPTNRYLFELNNPEPDSVIGGMVEIDGFQAANNNNFPGGNFNGVNIGFCKLEAGQRVGFDDYVVKNCYGNYIWRMIHLIGAIWSGRFENILTHSFNSTFVGDAHIILEDGGHASGNNPCPKINRFRNTQLYDTGGEFENAVRIKSGGYNQFDNLYVGGHGYRVAVLNMDNTDAMAISANTFRDVIFIDLTTPVVTGGRQAAIYLAGTACYDNHIFNVHTAAYPQTVKLAGGTTTRHNTIEVCSEWGNVAAITDTGVDPSNTYQIFGGSVGTSTAITHTGGVGKVIDKRKGAANGGTAGMTGDGVTTAFNIAHGVFKSPAWVMCGPGNAATMDAAPIWWTWGTTNITVNFKTAPANGAALSIRWRAEAYL